MLLRCLDTEHFQVLPDERVLAAQQLDSRLLPGEHVVVLLPASLSSITEVVVGAGEAELLRKTLPWRLEETLLSAPESLHFAHSPARDGRAAVTVVDKPALQELRSALATRGIIVNEVYAELSLVPWQSRQWSVWVQADRDQILVRHGWHSGFACSVANLAAALTLLQNEQQQWPEQIVVYGTRSDANAIEALLHGALQSLVVLRKQPTWEELLQIQVVACNVLQGSFAAPLPWQRWWSQWKLAAAMLIGLVLVDGLVTAVDTSNLRTRKAELVDETVALYRQAQPQGELVDPVLQLQQLVSASGGSEQRLLPLLSRMAPVLATEPGSTVEALDFDAATGELQVELRSSGLSVIESLRSKLQAAGLVAELVGSSSEGNTNRSRLRVVGS